MMDSIEAARGYVVRKARERAQARAEWRVLATALALAGIVLAACAAVGVSAVRIAGGF